MIGLFNDSFPPIMDGVALCTQNYAEWLHRSGKDVCVVCPDSPGNSFEADYPIYRYLSVPVPKRHPYRLGLAQLDWGIQRKLRQTAFSLVHAHSPFSSGRLALKTARSQQIPLVASFHSKFRSDFERLVKNRRLVDRIVQHIVQFYYQADQVWVPQEAVIETLREYDYKGRIEVVENGNDMGETKDLDGYRKAARQQLQVDAEKPILLFVGQHIAEKNVHFIIDALADLRELDYEMHFIGTGYAVRDMKAQIEQLGLGEKVKLLGCIYDRELLKQHYAAADLFLFPSLYDNAPLVLREAAAMGCPGLLIEHSTASDIIEDGQNGYLSRLDTKSYAEKIRSILSQTEQRKAVAREAKQSLARPWSNIVEEVSWRYAQLIDNYKSHRSRTNSGWQSPAKKLATANG